MAHPQSIVNGRIHQLSVAEPVAIAAVLHKVRACAHVLHAARHDVLRITRPNRLGGEDDGLEAGAADLVNGRRGHTDGQTALDGGLPGRILPQSRLDDVTHQDFIRLDVVRHAGALDGLRDCDCAQLWSGHA